MFERIVFAYDGSEECRNAIDECAALASRFNSCCFLLAVIPRLPALAMAEGPLPVEVVEGDRHNVQSVLDEGVARLRSQGIETRGELKVDEEPARAIGAFAREVKADLVIVGHHRRPVLSRWWHGSVGHSLLDHVSCSVLVSMPEEAKREV